MTTSTGGWLGARGWQLRPDPHTGQDLHEAILHQLELDRIKGRRSADPAQLEDRRRHRHALMAHHRIWQHAPAFDRDAWVHVVPLERELRILVGRTLIRLALFWLRRRGLDRGLIECAALRWRWALGDFHEDLAAAAREDELRHVREIAQLRAVARREILEELRTMAEARRSSSSAQH